MMMMMMWGGHWKGERERRNNTVMQSGRERKTEGSRQEGALDRGQLRKGRWSRNYRRSRR